MEEGPWFLSSLKKEFSEETKIVKKIKSVYSREQSTSERTQVGSEWLTGYEGDLGCLYGTVFQVVSGQSSPYLVLECACVSANMDYSWHLLPPFVLPLDWGASLCMCQAGKSTRMHPAQGSMLSLVSHLKALPFAAVQSGAYLLLTATCLYQHIQQKLLENFNIHIW